jgi:murein DD-endopeptidase MepM/ murein hydrolase activator NlpD
MVKEPQSATEGALLVAPADGVVEQSFRHGNAGNMIQIDHGGDWYATYIHLQSRAVQVGTRVKQGQTIGRVGKDGETSNGVPHLHFETAIDTNGDGRASWGTANSERVRPWFNGVEYGQANGRTWRNVQSRNCGQEPPHPHRHTPTATAGGSGR